MGRGGVGVGSTKEEEGREGRGETLIWHTVRFLLRETAGCITSILASGSRLRS